MKDKINLNTACLASENSIDSYKRLSDSMISSLKVVSQSYTDIANFEIRDVTEAMKKMLNTYLNVNMTYVTSGLLTEALSNSLKEMMKPFMLYEMTSISEAISLLSKSMNSMFDGIATDQLRYLSEIDYSTLFANIVPEATSISQVVKQAYSFSQINIQNEQEYDESFTEDEVQEVLQEQISNPEGFQRRIASWTEKKKIQFFIVWQVICFLYGNFMQPYFQEKIGIPVTSYIVSNVKEFPQKGANIICKLKEDVTAIIVEDTNYYYKVTFTDEEGIEREGYVAKRNLKMHDDEVEERADK